MEYDKQCVRRGNTLRVIWLFFALCCCYHSRIGKENSLADIKLEVQQLQAAQAAAAKNQEQLQLKVKELQDTSASLEQRCKDQQQQLEQALKELDSVRLDKNFSDLQLELRKQKDFLEQEQQASKAFIALQWPRAVATVESPAAAAAADGNGLAASAAAAAAAQATKSRSVSDHVSVTKEHAECEGLAYGPSTTGQNRNGRRCSCQYSMQAAAAGCAKAKP